MKNILIAEDAGLMRCGLRMIVETAILNARVEEAVTEQSTLVQVSSGQWDLVIADVNMESLPDFDLLKEIRNINALVPVLVIGDKKEEIATLSALKQGGHGYLQNNASVNEIVNAAQTILRGKKYIPDFVADRLADHAQYNSRQSVHHHLSPRELEIMRLLASGFGLTEIAHKLSVGVTTISTYRSRISKKMGLSTNAALLEYMRFHDLNLRAADKE